MIQTEGGGRFLGALLVEIENGDLRAVPGEQAGGRENPIPRGLAAPEMTAVLPSSNIVSSRMTFDYCFLLEGTICRLALLHKRDVYTLC